MIVDVHHHLQNEPDYADRLIDECDRLRIDKVCLCGVDVLPGNCVSPLVMRGKPTPPVNNDDVERVCKQYPDRLIPFGYIRLGRDKPETVDMLHTRGFLGLKFMFPLSHYGDHAYYPVYERAEKYGMPCLFHTGMCGCWPTDSQFDITSVGMQPVYLDGVARKFPNLSMIAAHLGNGYHTEAAWMARIHPNIYLDITMGKGGWLPMKGPEFLRDLLYWPGAYEKLVFGTDVHYTDMEYMYDLQSHFMNCLNASPETLRWFFGNRVASMLGLL
jgi:predicted TIM-barrel fold metal-dependent hydrolase